MIVEAVELYADVLADSSHGINAQIAALVTGGYIDPARAPGSITIGAETRDAQAALGRNMDAAVSATVFFAGMDDGGTTSEIVYLTGLISLGVRVDVVGTRPQLDAASIGFLVRGILRSTRWWQRDAPLAGLYQTRNGIQVAGFVSCKPAMFAPTPEAPINTFGVRLVLELRDAIPD